MDSTTSDPADPKAPTLRRSDAALGERATPVDGFEQAWLAQTLHEVLWNTEEAAQRQIDRYTILRRLGAGGMGVVYAAYDQKLDRKVALKLIRPERASDHDAQERLLREARAMARLSHRSIVQIYEVGQVGTDIFLAMEFIEGQTLDAWLAARPRTLREIVRVFIQAGEGLAAAHAAGLVHRDFKPSNVIVCEGEQRIVVIDFGLARVSATQTTMGPAEMAVTWVDNLTATGVLAGTPAYMSPEQFRAQTSDTRSDQFSFCVSLYEAILGIRPFPCSTPAQIFSWVEDRAPPQAPPRSLPAVLRRAILRGLRITPSERWPSMHALLNELHRFATRRRRLVQATVAIVLLVVLAGLLWSLWQAQQRSADAQTERAKAQRSAATSQALREVDRLLESPDLAAEFLLQQDLDSSAVEYREAMVRLYENILPQATLIMKQAPVNAWFRDDGEVSVVTLKSLHAWRPLLGRIETMDTDESFYPGSEWVVKRDHSGRRMAKIESGSGTNALFVKHSGPGPVVTTERVAENVSSVSLLPNDADFVGVDRVGKAFLSARGQTLPISNEPLEAGISFCASSKGEILAAALGDGRLVYWDLRDEIPRPREVVEGTWTSPVIISNDQKYMFSEREEFPDDKPGTQEGFVWRIDEDGMTLVHTVNASFGLAVAFSGSCLVTADYRGSVTMACDKFGSVTAQDLGFLPDAKAVKFSDSGDLVAVVHRDATVTIHAVAPGLEKIATLRQESDSARVIWDPFSPRLLTISQDHESTYRLRVWDLQALLSSKVVVPALQGGTADIQVARDIALVHGSGGQSFLVPAASLEPYMLEHPSPVISGGLAANGMRAFTITDQCLLYRWEISQGGDKSASQLLSQYKGCLSVVPNATGEMVALIEEGGVVRLVSAEGATLRVTEAGATIKTLRWSVDSAFLVVVTSQNRVLALDTKTEFAPVEILPPGPAPIYISNSGEHVLGAPNPGILRLWRTDGANPLVMLAETSAESPTQVAWGWNPQVLAYATSDGGVYLWDRRGGHGRVELMRGQQQVQSLEFSRDDESLFVGADAGMRVARLDRLDLVPGPLLGGQNLHSLATFEGTDTLLSVHGSGGIWAWSTEDLRAVVGKNPKMCLPQDLRHLLLRGASAAALADGCDIPSEESLQSYAEFVGVGRGLEAKKYDLIGRKIRVRCWISVENGAWRQGGVIYLRLDRDNMTHGYFVNSERQIVQGQEWREVVLEGTVGADIKTVAFGAFVQGDVDGKFRDLTLEVWREGEWTPVAAKNLRIESGLGSNWGVVGSRELGELDVRDGILHIARRSDRKWLKTTLSIEPGRWSELRVRAWMRVEKDAGEDSGNLSLGSLRYKLASGGASSAKIASPVWSQYTVQKELPYHGRIEVHVTLSKNGRLWIDEVTVEGKSADGLWEPVDLRNPGFEEGEAGWTHSENAGVRLTQASYHGRYALELGPP